MFLWIKLNGVEDTTDLIKKKAVEELVLMVPGKLEYGSFTDCQRAVLFSNWGVIPLCSCCLFNCNRRGNGSGNAKVGIPAEEGERAQLTSSSNFLSYLSYKNF